MSLIYTQPTSRNNLYLGGKDDAKSLPRLQQRNVHRILNVTPAKEAGITAGVPNFFEGKSGPRGHKIQYKRIPVYDASTSDMLSYADEIVNFISNGLHHGSVLVHCQRGVSRSATAIVMFLIRKANMTYEQSLSLCQRRRPVVDPIPAFREQLMKYEKECREWGYLTAVEVDEVKKQTLTNDARTGVQVNSSPAEKRKVDAVEEANGPKEIKKSRVVGPMPPPQKPISIGAAAKPTLGASVGPSPNKSASIGPSIKPTVGPSNAPSDRKSESLGLTITNHSDNIDIKSNVVEEKRRIGPEMPPPS